MGIASENGIPMVLDADALNIISSDTRFLCLIPKGSVLTPHEGEARRLFHVSGRDEQELIDYLQMGFRLLYQVRYVSGDYQTQIYVTEKSVQRVAIAMKR